MAHENYPAFYEQLQTMVDRLKGQIPGSMRGFDELHRNAVGDGSLSHKVKELIAMAIAVSVRCDGCIAYHVRDAMAAGASEEEIAEAIAVAVLMGGGPAVVYGAQALEAAKQFQKALK